MDVPSLIPRPPRPAFVACSTQLLSLTASNKSWVWRPGNEARTCPGGASFLQQEIWDGNPGYDPKMETLGMHGPKMETLGMHGPKMETLGMNLGW